MTDKTIIVVVKPDGSVKVEAQGFTGTGCQAATRAIEEALGLKKSDTMKPEYYENPGDTKQQQGVTL
jgi:hypothetical protein